MCDLIVYFFFFCGAFVAGEPDVVVCGVDRGSRGSVIRAVTECAAHMFIPTICSSENRRVLVCAAFDIVIGIREVVTGRGTDGWAVASTCHHCVDAVYRYIGSRSQGRCWGESDASCSLGGNSQRC